MTDVTASVAASTEAITSRSPTAISGPARHGEAGHRAGLSKGTVKPVRDSFHPRRAAAASMPPPRQRRTEQRGSLPASPARANARRPAHVTSSKERCVDRFPVDRDAARAPRNRAGHAVPGQRDGSARPLRRQRRPARHRRGPALPVLALRRCLGAQRLRPVLPGRSSSPPTASPTSTGARPPSSSGWPFSPWRAWPVR